MEHGATSVFMPSEADSSETESKRQFVVSLNMLKIRSSILRMPIDASQPFSGKKSGW
jgi:hypothetical protein